MHKYYTVAKTSTVDNHVKQLCVHVYAQKRILYLQILLTDGRLNILEKGTQYEGTRVQACMCDPVPTDIILT